MSTPETKPVEQTKPVEKNLGQKIAFVFAILFYIAAAGCALGAVLYQSQSTIDPIRASLAASVFFFISSGFVLQVIATSRLKGLLSGGGQN